MEPRIQYAKTSDGVSIAYWTIGEGVPLLNLPGIPYSHIQLEWQGAESRRWYERLARNRMVIRYDARGTGLSDRDVPEYSLDAYLLDLEAVVDRLGLERFALVAVAGSGAVAITYTARHPERVSHLLLWYTWARGSDFIEPPQVQGLLGLIGKDWVLYTEALAHARLGWSETEQARQFAAFIRESTTPEAVQAAMAVLREVDVTDLLPQVKSPTLVLHRRQTPLPDVSVARGLASRIPDARLALLEGTSILPWSGDMEAVLQAIDEFLGEGEEAAASEEPPAAGGFRTVLFTDVEGSTALTQRLGDAGAREVLREHDRITREVLKAHGGSEVKTMGDGFMASFASVTRAVECAIALQRAFAERNASASEPLHIRVGLNAGEPIEEEGPDGRSDLFGATVILAARIAARAEGGQILASLAVRELCAGKGFLFADTGEVTLKGFEEPVWLFAVREGARG